MLGCERSFVDIEIIFASQKIVRKGLKVSLAVHIRRDGHESLEAAARERERERGEEIVFLLFPKELSYIFTDAIIVITG